MLAVDLYWFALGPGAYRTTPRISPCTVVQTDKQTDRLQTQGGRAVERERATSCMQQPTLPPPLYRHFEGRWLGSLITLRGK